mgnify:FL=1
MGILEDPKITASPKAVPECLSSSSQGGERSALNCHEVHGLLED